MSASNWVHLEDCTVRRVTDKAMLIDWDGGYWWIPLSQVSEAGDTMVTISVTEWIANEKGIEAD